MTIPSLPWCGVPYYFASYPDPSGEIESTAIKYSTSVLLCQMGLETDGLEDGGVASSVILEYEG